MFHSPDPHTRSLPTHIQQSLVTHKELSDKPCYIYDVGHIQQQIENLRTRQVAGGLTIRYAMKANPLKGILALMHNAGVAIDACSDYEAYRALAAWIPADQIQITGQTRPQYLPDLIEKGVRFCACSLFQLEEYGKLFPGTSVGIRLNPGIGSGQFPGVNVGGERSSFGVWHSYIPEILALADQYDLHITTLHTHIWSGSDPAIWQDVAELSLSFALQLPEVTRVDLWWGLKVARMTDEKQADIHAIGERISTAFARFEQETGRRLHLEIEPGTYLIANAGYIACTIDDIIDTGPTGEIFVKLDIGMSEIIRPIMYGARHPIWVDTSTSEDNISESSTLDAIVVGHSCESSDMLTVDAKGVALRRSFSSAIKRGNRVLIGGTWAYCSSMSTKHYNSYPRIAEYLLLVDGDIQLLRPEESMEAVRAGEL